MPKQFAFSAEFGHSVEQVHALVSDPAYWGSRWEANDRSSVQVAAAQDADGAPVTVVTMTELVDTDGFPALVRKAIRGDVRMERIDTWRPLEGGRAAGRVDGNATGVPVAIVGEYDLRPSDTGAVLDVRGTVTVKVPIIGGQIEKMVEQMVEQMVTRDRDDIDARLGAAN
ncbi:DUF2505 domain-containing protein [Prescottella subtropica]|uniref:DUF2505 domain-containing protein n=1 Tax=Prescottella subtropica TaxID=2545757 RepID=UPI0010F85723|nr:DUF2505 domain-containing protein [Prescottella subtropica]